MSMTEVIRQWIIGMALSAAWAGGPVLAEAPSPVGDPPAWTPPERAEVFVVQDDQAMNLFVPRPERVASMIQRGLTAVTGRSSPREAWLSLVSTQDVVGIKVFSKPGVTSGTRPAVVIAVVQSLLSAGLPPQQIVIWDRHEADLKRAGFSSLADRFGIRVEGAAEASYNPDRAYETALVGRLTYGDYEFGQEGPGIGRKSFGSRVVVEKMDKIISIAPLFNHSRAGVSGHLYGLALDAVDNTMRFENSRPHFAEAIPEIIADEDLAIIDRFVLGITDALLCQYEGEARQLLHYSTMLNQLWFGRDLVALDVLALEELTRHRERAGLEPEQYIKEIYENAALLELGVGDRSKIELIRAPLP